MEDGVKPKYEDGPGQVFEGKFEVRDDETKRFRVHRSLRSKEEIALLKLVHPNIVKLLHCGSDNEYRYYELGRYLATLDQLFLNSDDIRKYKGRMPHHIDSLLQLASGLEYIHSNNIVHGDIKPENVLIMEGSADQDEITLKWTNFRLITNVSGRRQKSPIRRNKAWLAPELPQLSRNIENVDEISYPESVMSDVFALGLVFGSLFLNGEHLYGPTGNENEIADNIVRGNPINMQKMDGKLRGCYGNDLLAQMLRNDPNERITSKEVVVQLHSIKEELTGKEKELLKLCGRDSREDLTGNIKEFIQFGINVNAKDKEGRNALHLLCQNYSNEKLIDAIQLLIQLGIDVNSRGDDGMNALHYLCQWNESPNLIDAIQLLIQLGIDVNAKDSLKTNALHYLCMENSSPNLIDAIQLLIPLGIDVNAKDDGGMNALYYLFQSNTSPNLIDAIQLLIQLGIDVNSRGDDGMNALHYLCQWNLNPNLIDVIQLLIQLGIDVHEKDNSGKNALHYLCKWDSSPNLIDAIQLLIQQGMDVISNGHDARTYLRANDKISNKDEILKLLDEALLV